MLKLFCNTAADVPALFCLWIAYPHAVFPAGLGSYMWNDHPYTMFNTGTLDGF